MLLIMALLLALSAGIGGAVRSARESATPERAVTYRPLQVEEDGYVSSRRCRACHPSQYASWYGSYHRTMTQLAAPDAVRASFDRVTVSGVQDRPMSLERRGRELWAEFDDPDWNGHGESLPRIQRQVVMLTGSHQQQVYWYRTAYNRLLGQLPGMYLIDERRWIPRRAAFLRPPPEHGYSETGRWNAVCIDCHATNGKRRLNAILGSQPIETLEAGTTVAEFGIACEACHGPSDEHVRANRNPLRRYRLHLTGDRDPTIVNPTRLTARLSSQVCGQCHGTSLQYDRAGVPPPDAGALPYRPGSDLDRTHFVLQPTQNLDSPLMRTILESDPAALRDSFWSDGMIRVSGREYNGLIDSPCFKDARDERRTLSCASCHTMHKTADDPRSITEWADTHQVSAGMNGNEACLQCHPALRADLTAHTKHRAAFGRQLLLQLPHAVHVVRSSESACGAIRSAAPRQRPASQTGRPNACNLCHLDKTLAWTAEYLEKWYGTPPTALEPDERTIPASMLWLLRGDAGQRALDGLEHGLAAGAAGVRHRMDGAVAFGAHERSV